MASAIEIPQLPPRVAHIENPRRGIGLVGCGQIASHHLRAYRAAGYHVVALANPTLGKAEGLRNEFYPGASIHGSHRDLLEIPGIEIIDVTTHPDVRAPILQDCMDAKRHILTQKPFVTDLESGAELCDRAESQGTLLAVNQNGRFSPHFHWMVAAVQAGLIGRPRTLEVSIHWDHSWVLGTRFDSTDHLILFDFGIHWFDIATLVFAPDSALEVEAEEYRVPGQATRQPMGARASVRYAEGSAVFEFNGATSGETSDRTRIEGTEGVLESAGPDLQHQTVTLTCPRGTYTPRLEGHWFDDGFHGAMAELLRAVESGDEPSHSGRRNLTSLATALAVCASARNQGEATPVPSPRGTSAP